MKLAGLVVLALYAAFWFAVEAYYAIANGDFRNFLFVALLVVVGLVGVRWPRLGGVILIVPSLGGGLLFVPFAYSFDPALGMLFLLIFAFPLVAGLLLFTAGWRARAAARELTNPAGFATS